MSSRGHRLVIGASAGALLLAVAGCNKAADDAGNTSAAALPALPATLPMTNAPAPQAALAPPPAAIRSARPIRAVRVADPRGAYAYADQAGYFSQSLGNGPPDYGFDYDGVRPWAWQGYEGSLVFVEPVDDGYRYYYYRAGADRPYFVRDPDYAYGYDGDQLAAVYGPDGGLVPYADYGPRLGYAAAYLWRAERLFEASRERQAISAAAWEAQQDSIIASRERWADNRDRQAGWAAYHAQESAQESHYWAQEAARREADGQRFAAWRQQDFRTPPPPRAIPTRWQQASWAQDSARYASIAAAAVAGGAVALAVHHQQAVANARQPAFATPRAQPMAPPRVLRPEPAMRPQGREPNTPRFVASPPPVVHEGRGAPRETPPAMRAPVANPAAAPRERQFAFRQQQPTPQRPSQRAEEPRVTVHTGNGAPFRAQPTMQRAETHAPAPRPEMANPAPRDRPPEASHAPATPRGPEPAPPHGGGGHPAGGHPGGENHGDHRH